jgi:hypothetical protein
MYEEKPSAVLIMPPINKTDNIEAKDIFHSTLSRPVCNAGYYVIPSLLSMEILKHESAYDAELFLNTSLTKFGEVFGADMVLFTIIHNWKKKLGRINVEIEYIFKSTKTNTILYRRTGNINLAPTFMSGGIDPVSLAVAATMTIGNLIDNATTQQISVGIICNNLMLSDLPAGPYSPLNGKDGDFFAGAEVFKATLSGFAKGNIRETTANYSIYAKEKKDDKK